MTRVRGRDTQTSEDGHHMTAESTDYEGTTMLGRVRSAVLLVALLVVIGAAAAGILGVVILAATSFLDHALG